MGNIRHEWQDSDTILLYFGKRRKKAIEKYQEFITGGIHEGHRPDLVGGGLIRSLGGWSQVKSLRRVGGKIFSDERILGNSEFVKDAITNAEEKAKETLRLKSEIMDLGSLANKICGSEGVKEELLIYIIGLIWDSRLCLQVHTTPYIVFKLLFSPIFVYNSCINF